MGTEPISWASKIGRSIMAKKAKAKKKPANKKKAAPARKKKKVVKYAKKPAPKKKKKPAPKPKKPTLNPQPLPPAPPPEPPAARRVSLKSHDAAFGTRLTPRSSAPVCIACIATARRDQ